MKRLLVTAVGFALLGLTACSSSEPKTAPTADVAPAAKTDTADADQQKINDLQNRLDGMKPAGTKYQGSANKNLRTFLNQEYLKLGQAKETLRQLRTATGNQAATLQTQLDNTLNSISQDLNTRAAE